MIVCDRLAVCKHWRWLRQCKVCDSTALSERLGFLEFERNFEGLVSSLVCGHGVTLSSCKMCARTYMRDLMEQSARSVRIAEKLASDL